MTPAPIIRSALDNSNLQAFLVTIRRRESSVGEDAWTMLYGGSHFADFADHPRRYFPLPGGLRTSAAGAFQIVASTWDSLRKQYPDDLPDFSPASQTFAAVALIAGRGALDDVLQGRFEQACVKLRPEWTSMPGAAEAGWDMAAAKSFYLAHGGRLDLAELITPTPAPEPQPAVEQETRMPIPLALIAALGPVISELIPQIARAFDKKAETPAKIEAASRIVETITKATGAVNVQEAVEKMQADPAIRQVATAAVLTDEKVSKLLEIGGGIEAARKAASDPAAPPFWRQGAFVVALVLTPLIYMTVYRVLWSPDYSEQLRTVVVTAILSGLLGALTGYFFGSMYSSNQAATTRRATDEVKA